jgi:hypothetical protein
MRLILEYSEEQGVFHNNRHDSEQNTNGYETVGFIAEDNSYKFVDYFRKEYGYDKHSIDFVIEKFMDFTGEEL